jgi:hypothetical protein
VPDIQSTSRKRVARLMNFLKLSVWSVQNKNIYLFKLRLSDRSRFLTLVATLLSPNGQCSRTRGKITKQVGNTSHRQTLGAKLMRVKRKRQKNKGKRQGMKKKKREFQLLLKANCIL